MDGQHLWHTSMNIGATRGDCAAITLKWKLFIWICQISLWIASHRLHLHNKRTKFFPLNFGSKQNTVGPEIATANQARLFICSLSRQMKQSGIITVFAFQRLSTFDALNWILSTGYWFNRLRSEPRIVFWRWNPNNIRLVMMKESTV